VEGQAGGLVANLNDLELPVQHSTLESTMVVRGEIGRGLNLHSKKSVGDREGLVGRDMMSFDILKYITLHSSDRGRPAPIDA
jgi:hypothetical protein